MNELEEMKEMTRKWREWCEARAPTGAVPLDRVPRLLLALVRDEREACAKLCDDAYLASGEYDRDLAEAIRERGR